MTQEELLKMRDLAEVGKVQFKERIIDKYDVSCELVAMSNTHGGKLIVGIDDKSGRINAMSYKELQETTNMLSDMASENVIPSILIEDIENVPVEGGAVVVATISEGRNKPYHDNKGIIWKKNGADKRKVFDNSELAEMMQECGSFNPDEATVQDATIDDLDAKTIKEYLSNRFSTVLQKKGFVDDRMEEASLAEVCDAIHRGSDIGKILRNLHFIRPNGTLTVAAMLLFGKYTQRWLPVMTTKCICFVGNSVGGTLFRDKVQDATMEGNLLHQYDTIMAFFLRNLRTIQPGTEFNTQGKLEIPYTALMELTVNALVHRSLNWKAPIRVFIFDNRVEIHSPGELPNGLTTDDILAGVSMPRNNFLFNNAVHLLPYTGAGSGIQRAVDAGTNVKFENNENLHEFVITIMRPEHDTEEVKSNQVEDESNQVTNQATEESNQVEGKSNQVTNQVAEESNQVKMDRKIRKKDLVGVQKNIINFCSVPRTTAEILSRIGVSNQTKNKLKYVIPLVEAGFLEMTNPESPSAPNQKYRRVKK